MQTYNLDLLWLTPNPTEAHVIPGLDHTSLAFTKQFCDGGCKVTFGKDKCRVYYDMKLIFIGKKEPTSDLWIIPVAA